MYKNIIVGFWIFILYYKMTYALPIGFLILGGESFLLIGAALSTIFFTIFFYFKKLSILNKIISFVTISLLLFGMYLGITHYYYNNTNIETKQVDTILP